MSFDYSDRSCALWDPKVARLFAHYLVQANNIESIKAPHYW